MLNQENIQSPLMKCRRNWFIFFLMEVYLENMMEQFNSGDLKKIFRNISRTVLIGLIASGRKPWQEERKETRKDTGGGGNKSTDSSQRIVYLRALQGHSGRSLTDPTPQDNVIIPDGFFQYIYHVGCAINLHPINSGLIPGSQILSNRQTIFSACGSHGQGTQSSWENRLGSTASCTCSVAILAQAIPCSNVQCFSRWRAFLVLSCPKCLQPSFVVSHLFPWQVLMMGPMCLSLLCLVPLRIMLLLMVLAQISTEWVIAKSMRSSKISEMLLPFARGFADFDNQVRTFSAAVGMVTSRISSVEQTVNVLSAKMAMFAAMEQNFNTLTARVCNVETCRLSIQRFRFGKILAYTRTSWRLHSRMVPWPRVIWWQQKHTTKTWYFLKHRRRSAVLLRFPCEQYLKGITKWIDTLWEESNMPACN